MLPLTGATFASALTDHPLLFVLFYNAERIQGTHLLTNYSLAADELRQAHNLVKVKLAWLEVRWDDAERVAISRRFGSARVDTLRHTAPPQHPVAIRLPRPCRTHGVRAYRPPACRTCPRRWAPNLTFAIRARTAYARPARAACAHIPRTVAPCRRERAAGHQEFSPMSPRYLPDISPQA